MLQYNATFGDFVLDLNRKRSAFASKVHHASGQPLWVNTQVPEMDGTASAGTARSVSACRIGAEYALSGHCG